MDNGNATSRPYTPRAIGDLGPGQLSGAGPQISDSLLANIAQSNDTGPALAAEAIRRATKVNCNFAAIPFSIQPPASLGGVLYRNSQ